MAADGSTIPAVGGEQPLRFDRILCDVPCSGDGTLRKSPVIWRRWNAGPGNMLHKLQLQVACKGVRLLKVGGRLVYSTCSLNPIENESVVAGIVTPAPAASPALSRQQRSRPPTLPPINAIVPRRQTTK